VAHDADREVRLALQQGGRGGRLGLLLDLGPLLGQARDVGAQLFLARPLGRGAHDYARALGDDLAQQLLQARALLLGQLARDARHPGARDEHEVAARERDLRGQASTLVPDRVLGDLHEHRVARLERGLDATRLALEARSVPVDLARVQHRVAALADVDEGRLHARQHVLHAAEVDVADHRGLRRARDVVLGEHAVLEHRDLRAAVRLAHDHRPLDRLAPGEELRLGEDLTASARVTALAAPLALGLEPRRAARRGDLVRTARRLGVTVPATRARTTTPTTAARATALALVLALVVARRALSSLGRVVVGVLGRVLRRVLPRAATATATTAATAPAPRGARAALVRVLVRVLVVGVLVLGVLLVRVLAVVEGRRRLLVLGTGRGCVLSGLAAARARTLLRRGLLGHLLGGVLVGLELLAHRLRAARLGGRPTALGLGERGVGSLEQHRGGREPWGRALL